VREGKVFRAAFEKAVRKWTLVVAADAVGLVPIGLLSFLKQSIAAAIVNHQESDQSDLHAIRSRRSTWSTLAQLFHSSRGLTNWPQIRMRSRRGKSFLASRGVRTLKGVMPRSTGTKRLRKPVSKTQTDRSRNAQASRAVIHGLHSSAAGRVLATLRDYASGRTCFS
jgi:hypothetical protein